MEKKFTITLENKEWEKCIDDAFKTKAKDIKIDGFRKGNVPKDMYIKKFGVESLFMDAADAALPQLYTKLMADNKELEPAVMPTVDIKEINEEKVTVEFTVIEKPEIKLGKYKNLGIVQEEVTVTDKEVEHELYHLKEQFIELKDKKGTIANGDEVTFDFEGFKDGVAFDGGKANDHKLVIGSGTFIPGFEEQMIGMAVEETKELNVTFPKDYHAAELKGAPVVFKVKVNKISERVMPEYNEDFFKDLAIPEVDSEEKLVDFIKENIKTHKESHLKNDYVEACLEKAVENAAFEIPSEMISEESGRMLNEFSEQIKMQGIELEQYLQMMGKTEDELKETFKEEATKRVGFRLMIEAVVKKEKFEVTEDEIKNHVLSLASRYGVEESEFLKNVGGEKFVKYDLEFKKAIELITE